MGYRMYRSIIPLLALIGAQATAFADERPLMCFGTEPFWSLDLTTSSTARFSTPDGESLSFEGKATRLDWLQEGLWRGTDPDGGVLVAFLSDEACSDNMSDTTHPVTVRASLPDGQFLAGCCRLVTAGSTETASLPLEGSRWQLSALDGVTQESIEGLSQPVNLSFNDGTVAGFAGCNRFSGGYEIQGTQLILGNSASTMMACPEPGMSIEQSFRALFSGTLEVSLAGDQMTLSSPTGGALTLDREPPPQLAMTRWRVTGFNNGRQAVVGPEADSALTLRFDDGEISGDSGCNRFNGSYTIEGDRISMGPLMSTRRLCPEPLMDQEQLFLAALQSAVRWQIDGNTLDMHQEGGSRAIWAVRE